MIDAVNLLFLKMRLYAGVEIARARKVVAEWLFDNDTTPARAFGQTGRAQSLGDLGILAGLGRKIEQNVARGLVFLFDFAQRFGNLFVQYLVADVARQVGQAPCERLPEVFVERLIF